MWHTVIGFLVVHPSLAQAHVPGVTVLGKQFVNQIADPLHQRNPAENPSAPMP